MVVSILSLGQKEADGCSALYGRPNQPAKQGMKRDSSREIRKRGLDKLKDEYRMNL